MSSKLTYEPFSSELYNDFFKNFLRPFRFEFAPPTPGMKLEVSERDDAFRVRAEVPGVRREDIHVKIDGDRVSISAESRREVEANSGGKVLSSEFQYGALSRAFTLDSAVDPEKSSATYADGVLELTLPKRASNGARELPVQ